MKYLPNGKLIIKDNIGYVGNNEQYIQFNGKYNPYQTEQVNTTFNFVENTNNNYTIMPTGNYYKCTACIMTFDISENGTGVPQMQLVIGESKIRINNTSTFSDTFYFMPLLSNQYTHLVIQQNNSNHGTPFPIPYAVSMIAPIILQSIGNGNVKINIKICFA